MEVSLQIISFGYRLKSIVLLNVMQVCSLRGQAIFLPLSSNYSNPLKQALSSSPARRGGPGGEVFLVDA